jgi:N-acyl-D-aspartate/D-glutamate deacylase
MLDLLIRGGLVIDGNGSPRFHAAAGIGDERVSIRRGDASRLRAVSASIPR